MSVSPCCLFCYLVLEDVIDDGVDVGHVYLAVTVHVANDGPVFRTGSMAMTASAAVDDNMNHIVGIGDVDFTVAVHVGGVGQVALDA